MGTRGVLSREKFRRYLSVDEAATFVRAVSLLGQHVDDVDLTDRPRWCRDPHDEYLIALAEIHDAALLVSGDKNVLAVELPGLVVRSPRAALDLLQRRHSWGRPFTGAEESDARRQAAAEGHAEVLAASSLFLQAIADPRVTHLLGALVPPESLDTWLGDMSAVPALLADREMTNRPERPDTSCAYVKLPPGPGETIRATGDVLLPAGTVILTPQHRAELSSFPELGG